MAAERPRHLYTLLFGAGIVALLAGGFLFIEWTHEKPEAPDTSEVPGDDPTSHDREAPSIVEPVDAPKGESAHAPPTQPSEPAVAASFDPRRTPPPDDAPETTDRPPRNELTAEETLVKKQQALVLLDRTIERLEREHAELDRAGDAQEAKHVQVRLERMRKLREKRAAELDGGADAE